MAGKVLIVGVDSLIGSALADRLARQGRDVIGTTRRTAASSRDTLFLDLASDVTQWRPPQGIAVSVLTAAMNQQQCLEQPELSRRVNVVNTLAVARRLMVDGIRVVFPSTNLVFDCLRPNQPVDTPYRPMSLYAAQKAEVEQGLLQSAGLASVCRLAKIITGKLPPVSRWLNDLAANRPVTAFGDLNVAPVSLAYTAEFLLRVLDAEERGVFQITGAQELSYCELAKSLASACGRSDSLVECCNSADAGVLLQAAPRHPSLDANRVMDVFGLPPQPLSECLRDLTSSFEGSNAMAI
jgi:dTDP-4-dehydrorhamnose reductase